METEIRSVLDGLPDVRVERVASLWRVGVGALSGARKDGVELAHELRATYERVKLREQQEAEPEPVETTVFLQEPEPRVVHVPDPEQAAKIAALEARLAKHEAVKPDAPIPDHLADLISYADTPAQTSEKLLVKLREVLGLIGLAEDDGGRAAPEMYRKRDRLESGIQWNRGRLSEQI
jgi:hypothetical protein